MLICCLMAGVAAAFDYGSRRIPNRLMLGMLLWGVVHAGLKDSFRGILMFLGITVLTVLVLFPLYSVGKVGAGDVKLVALCCGFLGKGCVVYFLFVMLSIAALLALLKLLKYGRSRGTGVCMAGPVFLSLLLHMGGIY